MFHGGQIMKDFINNSNKAFVLPDDCDKFVKIEIQNPWNTKILENKDISFTRELLQYEAMNFYEDLWYKLCCYYNAKTELYDRRLTNLKSPYDKTEAFIDGRHRGASNQYAKCIRNDVVYIIKKLNIPKEIINKGFQFDYNQHLSAQGWIDEYNRLVELGEMDFVKELILN